MAELTVAEWREVYRIGGKTVEMRLCDRIAALEAALRAIYAAADGARDEQDWGDRVSAAMTDERRALVTQP